MIVTIITPGIRGAVVGQCGRFPLFQLAPPARSGSVDPQDPLPPPAGKGSVRGAGDPIEGV